jgi:hypothetical protein
MVFWGKALTQCLQDLSKREQHIYQMIVSFVQFDYSCSLWRVSLLCVAAPGGKFSLGVGELN